MLPLLLLLLLLPLSLASSTPTLPVSAPLPTRSTWQEAAGINASDRECTPYYFPPVAALIGSYPIIWKTANLEGSGIPKADKDFFEGMNGSIPEIEPRGTRYGNFTGVVYSDTDPDCWWSWSKCDTPKIPGIPDDITRCAEPETWGMSLDDGPNCTHNAFYDFLKEREQKATLFYIGSNVLDWPLEAQRGLADGHELCAHTWSHPYMTALTNEEVFSELYYSKKAILEVTGVTVQCWRPPYGDVDDRVRWIAQALGMRTVVWAEDTSDWKVSTIGVPAVEKNYETILTKATNGSYKTYGPIVLTHELNNGTMSLVEQFLPTIQKTFKNVMPIGVCNNNTQPYVEQGNRYVYPDAAQWIAGTRTISLLPPTAASKILNVVITNETFESGVASRVVVTVTGTTVAAATSVFVAGGGSPQAVGTGRSGIQASRASARSVGWGFVVGVFAMAVVW